MVYLGSMPSSDQNAVLQVDQLHQIYLEQTQVQRGARILEHNWRQSTRLGSQDKTASSLSPGADDCTDDEGF